MLSKRNNRAVALCGYTISGTYALGSVLNAVAGNPLASVLCGALSGVTGAVTNECTSVGQSFQIPTDTEQAEPAADATPAVATA